jgi:hypothetical protein
MRDANWPAATNLFLITVPAGPAFPDVSDVTVALLEGPIGTGGISFASAGPLFVH